MSDASQSKVMLLMLKGALLEAPEDERTAVLDTVEFLKTEAKARCGDTAMMAMAIANLELSLEIDV